MDKKEQKRLKATYRNMKTRSRESQRTPWPFDVEFTLDSFITWHEETKKSQNNKCAYCGSDQEKINALIEAGKLTSKRFNKRGRHLEVERRNPASGYAKDNCTLICYFCNNAKTDIFTEEEFIPIGKAIANVWEKRLKET